MKTIRKKLIQILFIKHIKELKTLANKKYSACRS